MRVAPQLRTIATEAGRITGQSVHVSGSGSTLFVAAGADRAAAAKAADRVLRGTGHPAIAVRLV
jgi:4-diphosphocytidyl-2C-methyl-D-erythritol kinase